MVWRAGEGRTNGAILFGGVTVEPDAAAEVDRTWFLGTSVRGIVPNRPDDNIGLQFTRLHYSDAARDAARAASLADGTPLRRRDTESVFEAHYGLQLRDNVRLAPNLQYVWNPGGDEGAKSGAAWGLRLDVSF
ncbi:Porin B precursor [Jannaschia aquimarina]|uniref:OprB_1 protein n=1 Tax=Jannaschia aquimarina TaxID=935700 RepID=A0A0D1EKX3_9RHOB|nr:Porin B precursor [Jannaschia aquimarina]SNS83109.1 porin [Jannaschia aquimarina]